MESNGPCRDTHSAQLATALAIASSAQCPRSVSHLCAWQVQLEVVNDQPDRVVRRAHCRPQYKAPRGDPDIATCEHTVAAMGRLGFAPYGVPSCAHLWFNAAYGCEGDLTYSCAPPRRSARPTWRSCALSCERRLSRPA